LACSRQPAAPQPRSVWCSPGDGPGPPAAVKARREIAHPVPSRDLPEAGPTPTSALSWPRNCRAHKPTEGPPLALPRAEITNTANRANGALAPPPPFMRKLPRMNATELGASNAQEPEQKQLGQYDAGTPAAAKARASGISPKLFSVFFAVVTSRPSANPQNP